MQCRYIFPIGLWSNWVWEEYISLSLFWKDEDVVVDSVLFKILFSSRWLWNKQYTAGTEVYPYCYHNDRKFCFAKGCLWEFVYVINKYLHLQSDGTELFFLVRKSECTITNNI